MNEIAAGIYVVGDTHFESKSFEQGEELIKRTVQIGIELNPSIIILLGDTLDTHETAKQSPFDQACRFIEQMSTIAPTYLQIGNHDFINQTQYLSDKHFFNPLKKWEGVVVVDRPIAIDLSTEDEYIQIVSCPYTPPGKLLEALDTLSDPSLLEEQEECVDWTISRCIFGHQEIKGVNYGGKESSNGDIWMPSFPPFISGHIHTECNIGDNVMYVGSSRQVSLGEDPNKKVWHILFSDPEDENYEYHEHGRMWIRKIELNLKGIYEVHLNYEDVSTFDFGMLKYHYITLHITGNTEQFKIFKKGQLYAKMVRLGVKVRFNPTSDQVSPVNIFVGDMGKTKGLVSFQAIFEKLIKTKSDTVKDVYSELYGKKQPRLIFQSKNENRKNIKQNKDVR